MGAEISRNEGVTGSRFSASRAVVSVRVQTKRRYRYGWAGLSSNKNTVVRSPGAFTSAEGKVAGIAAAGTDGMTRERYGEGLDGRMTRILWPRATIRHP